MKVVCVQDRESFLRLREEWDSLLRASSKPSVFLTHEWFLSWLDNLVKEGHLEIYLIQERKDLIGIAPFMRRGKTLSFLASEEVTDYCDLICLRGKEKIVINVLMDRMAEKRDQIQRLELINIQEDSPTLDLLPALAADRGVACQIELSEIAPRLDLTSSYEDYLSCLPRKLRHELRRKIRRMEQFETFDVRVLKDPVDLNEAINMFIFLHKNSGQDKYIFLETPGMEDFFRDMILRLSQKGWAELVQLYMQEKMIASLLTLKYGDTFLFYNIAFEQEFSSLSPGFYLFHFSILQAIRDKKRSVDFLRGEEKYKYDFGAKNSKIFNLILEIGASRR